MTATVKISGLPAATTPLTGTELVPVVQGGVTSQTTVGSFSTGQAISPSSITVSGLIASKPVFTDASKGLTNTGVVPVANGGTGSSATTYCSLIANVTGTLPVANGGTGQTTYTNGQLLIGNTSTTGLAKATLTAGAGISITNGAGSITIASTVAGTTPDFIVMSYGVI